MGEAEPASRVGIFNSSCLCGGQVLHFHVVRLQGSVLMWVGSQLKGLEDLQVATPTRFDPMPTVASLRGETEGNGSQLAQKLSRRFQVPVFLSFNLEAEPEAMLAVQKESTRLLSEILGPPGPPEAAPA
ncbi:unnamed protein product [Effrenium voratum]|uniref:Proteasome assembly chaperone 4 n=1 Tax=Effrenium voratum TaxID=2562239 RepID=A0AA36MUH2_9DINO|nr:unnamed protein product [Effrenium voratum]